MALRRILVIGCSGTGKSTLARLLAARQGLPLVHLDHEYWLPGWKQPQREAWRSKVAQLAARDTWVMDGNYAQSFDLRMPRADMIVFLDLPRWLAMFGILYRPLRYWGQQRADMASGCIERYDWPFVRYVWNFQQTERPKIINAIDTFGNRAKLIHLTSRTAVKSWLNNKDILDKSDTNLVQGGT